MVSYEFNSHWRQFYFSLKPFKTPRCLNKSKSKVSGEGYAECFHNWENWVEDYGRAKTEEGRCDHYTGDSGPTRNKKLYVQQKWLQWSVRILLEWAATRCHYRGSASAWCVWGVCLQEGVCPTSPSCGRNDWQTFLKTLPSLAVRKINSSVGYLITFLLREF